MVNKKAITAITAFIGVLLLILTFFILFSFFVTSSNIISTEAENLACRAIIEVEATKSYKIADEITNRVKIDSFLNNLRNRCPIERLNFKSNAEVDEVFYEISESAARCWFRYGEGELDFLSSFGTTGQWCFVCSTVEFESNTFVSPYKDYFDYVVSTKYREDSEGNPITYGEYFNLYIVDELSHDEEVEIQSAINDYLSSGEEILSSSAATVLEQYINHMDFQLKTISSDQTLYVVYRYNRVDESFFSGASGAVIGFLAPIVVASVLEGAAVGFAGAVACGGPVTGPLAAVCGAVAGAVKTIHSFFRGASVITRSYSSVTRLNRLSSLISNKYRSSKGITLLDRDTYNIVRNIDRATPDDLVGLANNVRTQNPNLAKDLDILGGIMKNGGYTDVRGVFGSSIPETRTFVDSIIRDVTNIDPGVIATATPAQKADYLRVAITAASAGVGGYVGANLNSNNRQYIDIMREEEYFRKCGTERKISDRLG